MFSCNRLNLGIFPPDRLKNFVILFPPGWLKNFTIYFLMMKIMCSLPFDKFCNFFFDDLLLNFAIFPNYWMTIFATFYPTTNCEILRCFTASDGRILHVFLVTDWKNAWIFSCGGGTNFADFPHGWLVNFTIFTHEQLMTFQISSRDLL